MVGLLADCDPGSDGEFSLRCHDWLRGISGREDVWTLAGKVATDARSLLNSIGLLRTALDMQTPVYGYASDCIDTVAVVCGGRIDRRILRYVDRVDVIGRFVR